MDTSHNRGSKRLLVVSPSDTWGGAERYTVRIATAACGEFNVAAAHWRSEQMNAFSAALRARDIRTFGAFRSPRFASAASFAFAVAVHRPDVVLLSLPWPRRAFEVRLMCAALNIPVVIVFQLVPAAPEISVRYRRLYGWARRRGERWVAVSEYGRRMLAEAFSVSPAAIEVIYNGPERRFADPVPDTAKIRERLGLDDGQPVVVSVGRISPEKGHELLIRATVELRSRHPGISVLIAGEGPEQARLQSLVRTLDLDRHVRLLGRMDDIPALLAISHVFALPSSLEGTPLALLEAMAAGLPVVATRFGGADELIDTEATGLLVELNDAHALASAIERLLTNEDLARRLGTNARSAIAAGRGQSMIEETIVLLRTAVDAAGHAR